MAEYRIIVDFNGGGDGYKSPNSKNQFENIEPPSFGDFIDDSIFNFAQKGVVAFAGLATVSAISEIGQEIFSQQVQKIERYTGSQQAQNMANAAISLAGKIFHPISSAINYVNEVEIANYNKKWESIGLQLYRERGGTALNRSRSEV